MRINLGSPVRVVLNSNPYLVYRDPRADNTIDSDDPANKVLTILYLASPDDPDELIAALNFEINLPSYNRPSNRLFYGNPNKLLFTLANLLPYLQPYPGYEDLIARFQLDSTSVCFIFSRHHSSGYRDLDTPYIKYFIPFDTDLFATARKIIFSKGSQKQEHQAILRVLENYHMVHPRKFMPAPELYSSLPIHETDFATRLWLMEEIGLVDILPDQTDENKIIGAKFKFQSVQSVNMVNINWGGQMNVIGSNNGTVSQTNTGNFHNLFNELRQEIAHRNESNKAEVNAAVDHLETEISKPGQEITGIQKAFEKLKSLASWAADYVGKLVIREIAKRAGLPGI